MTMDGTRVSQAVSRIEAALSRIERAAATEAAPSGNDGDREQNHTALQQTVRTALAELDSIIAKLER